MSETMIKIEHVSKAYRLGAIGGGTLRGDLQSFFARVRGKEDPNTMIGQDVYARNQRFLALDDVSFSVSKGERVGIIGHNGAGKSTLLKLLSRVTAPTTGSISYNGRIASMLEVGTGFHPELTGRENVYLNGAILGMSKAEIAKKFDDIVRFAEMEQFIDTPVKRYSSGMYVKLAFAVAAHLDADILVMDEVLAVGDMKFQQKCLGKMDDVSKNEGRTVLYVSHNMNTIRQLCTRCIVLDHGKLVFDGDVEAGIEQYLGQSGELATAYSYDEVPRSINESRKLQMMGLDVLGHTESRILQGEPMEFILHCKANEDVENVKFRFEVFSAANTIVGTVFSDKSISAKKNQAVDLQLSLSTKNFAPGKYRVAALAYAYNKYGTQLPFDRVEPALIFEITDDALHDVVWQSQYWGYVRFDDMQMKKIEVK